MSKINMTVSVESWQVREALKALDMQSENWTEKKRQRFYDEWKVLELNGCEIVQTAFNDGVMTVNVSQDFTQHLPAFGVHLQ